MKVRAAKTAKCNPAMKIKYYRVKFRATAVMGQITTEIAADSTTQVKQIVSNLYEAPYNLQIVGPFYR
jgi:hypothetical protein